MLDAGAIDGGRSRDAGTALQSDTDAGAAEPDGGVPRDAGRSVDGGGDAGGAGADAGSRRDAGECTPLSCSTPASCLDNCGLVNTSLCAGLQCDANDDGVDTCGTPDTNCQGWTVSYSGPGSGSLLSISGTSDSDIWAVGSNGVDGGFVGVILHWDGTTWTAAPGTPDTIWNGVSEASSDEVWVVGTTFTFGDGGTTTATYLHDQLMEGRAPQQLAGPLSAANAVWGSGADDVWIVGGSENALPSGDALLFHWNGTTLRNVLPNDFAYLAGELWGVSGTGPTQVWVAGQVGGNGSGLAEWNGTSWGPVGQFVYPLWNVWGTDDHDLWVTEDGSLPSGFAEGIVSHCCDANGWSFTRFPTTTYIMGIWGSGPSDVWAVGYYWASGGVPTSSILHWDGTSWAVTYSGTGTLLSGVWGSGPGDVWVVGTDLILHHTP
jgi:hypothetical protein